MVDYIRQIWNRLAYVCATLGTLDIVAHLDTFCIPEYSCDGFTTSDRWLVKQILHYLVFKGFTGVAIEVSSHALDQVRYLNANCKGFTCFLFRDHLS